MTSTDPCKMTSMWVWYLGDPAAPRRVGTVTLIPTTRRLSFAYAPEWENDGFPLSPDMPLKAARPIVPPAGFDAPGAIEDAMPDRWGQNMIRIVDWPRRVTPLDFLYFAGDRRFGALGISTEPGTYAPNPDNPLLTADSMEEANEIIQRVLTKQPLNERERELLRTSKMGGAHPKMLIAVDGEEWIAKFPKGDPVDLPLVEHASAVLAGQIGIRTAESRLHRISVGHVVLTRRFDRNGGKRVHALSARTMLAPEGAESYALIASVMRRVADAATLDAQRRELFSRMAYNILIENGDDHSKNHAFLRLSSGHYELAPAYDILPQMAGHVRQAIPVDLGVQGDDLESAVASCAKFGLSHDEAVHIWRNVARSVSRWKEVFSGVGVSGGDIERLAEFIDSPDRLHMRDERTIAALPRPAPPRPKKGRRVADIDAKATANKAESAEDDSRTKQDDAPPSASKGSWEP